MNSFGLFVMPARNITVGYRLAYSPGSARSFVLTAGVRPVLTTGVNRMHRLVSSRVLLFFNLHLETTHLNRAAHN